ncbi:MAG: radical SAM protein [Chloroflexi bacterium]|nr:radical SAM protein [Chloroflexota bacterium]
MARHSLHDTVKLIKKGVDTYVANRAMVVSYEVTLSCNCNCRHCDLGGFVEDETQIGPEEYADLTRSLKPLVAQISGGEPLLRKDIAAIVKAIKQSAGVPHVILVTNGVLLNESNYLQLREAGVNQFSVSLDFPDERHDEFRRRPGLYKRLEQTLPRLANLGFRDIVLNTAITRANLRDILPLVRKATEWNVSISYSAYTALRTNDAGYCINDGEDLEILRQAISELIAMKKQGASIVNSDVVLRNTAKFFERGYMPNCRAGTRFLIIVPNGRLVPCSLHRNEYSSRKEMMKDFSRTNRCGGCYVAIRSYSELSLLSHLKSGPLYISQTAPR